MPVLGKVGLVNRGTYSASATYTALDFVLYNGSSYVALKSVKGVTPSNDGTNWQTLAEGTAASLYLENTLTYSTAGQRALDAAQGPKITALIDKKANTADVPPKNHASTATTYGLGNASNYGHVKMSDTYSSKQASAAAANGIGASQNALYNAYVNRAPISHASTGTTYGIGNASNYGHVKLSDTYATKQSSAAAANGVGASQNALYNVYNIVSKLQSGDNTFEYVTLENNAYFSPGKNAQYPGYFYGVTGATGMKTQGQFAFESDGRISSRYRTRTSTSAEWGEWSSWKYLAFA